MKLGNFLKMATAAFATISFVAGLVCIAPAQSARADSSNNFSVWLDDLAKEGTVEPGVYNYGGSSLILVGESDLKYTVQGSGVTIGDKTYNTYKAGKRHVSANEIDTIPADTGAGTLTKFIPAEEGMFTVYFNSTSFLRIHDFNTADGSKNGYTDTGISISSYSFHVVPGHTYVLSTTGKTNNMFYAGYAFTVDEPVEVPVTMNNIDAVLDDTVKLLITDAALGGNPIELSPENTVLSLLKGHTYKITVNDGGVKALINDGTKFTVSDSSIEVVLYNVPDETLTGTIVGTEAGTVTKLSFKNMVNGQEYVATITGNSYSCTIKPGEYNTSVETTNNGKTYDRVSVKAGVANENEVYVELPKSSDKVPYKNEISVPGDYDTLRLANDAISRMFDRPVGEEGRITITLTADLFEQVVITQPYITLKGQGHEISWYYGVGTLYYSVNPSTGLYSKRLAIDKYSYAEGDGNLWGGVFIVRGDNFIAYDTTFRNTYNYYLTEAEKSDIAGSTLTVDRLSEGADVSQYAYKERSNAFYIDANNIECYNCKILSSQDTLGRNGSTDNNYHVYFKNCVIGGNVDYICGEFWAVFDECELQWKTYKNDEKNNAKIGYICAPKTSPYVFRNCIITTSGDEDDAAVSGLFGRTWGDNSKANFLYTETNGTITDAGWGEMSAGQGETAKFKEYANTNKGAAFETSGTSTENKTMESVEKYIDTAESSIVSTVLGNWRPVNYRNPYEPDPTPTPVPTATPTPEPEKTAAPTEAPAVTPVVSEAESGSSAPVIVGIIAAVLLIIAAVVCIIFKKKKQN